MGGDVPKGRSQGRCPWQREADERPWGRPEVRSEGHLLGARHLPLSSAILTASQGWTFDNQLTVTQMVSKDARIQVRSF